MAVARQKAKEHQVVIVLKGHHTLIASPDEQLYFNSTGNAGMAKGGSGDVLTGIIASLMAQSYESLQAAILGVYLHGLAGDHAAADLGQEYMIASDIISGISKAFKEVRDIS
jgi:NAD(P)H-hydrate epimerase